MTGSRLLQVVPDPSDRCPGFITDLILRCADGEEAALGKLFDLFLPTVLGVVGDGTASLETDALVVAAFQRLWAQAATYDPAVHSAVSWVVEQARDVQGVCLTSV